MDGEGTLNGDPRAVRHPTPPWALGTSGLLDDDAIRRWEAVAKAEAQRLRAQAGPKAPAAGED
jgi:hypothetical protein